MTNPTLPLTAEDLAKRLEAYAAQQNAELVATVSQLNSLISELKQQLADVEKVCKPHKRMGAGGCDAMSESRRQAKNKLAKQVLAIIQSPKEAT